MNPSGIRPSLKAPPKWSVPGFLALAGLAAITGLIALPLTALDHAPALRLLALPLAAAGAAAVLSHTHLGLCFAAFAITPLGVVQQEIAEVTINLPEAIILGLVLKEAIRTVYRRETFAPTFPLIPVAAFAGVALIAVGTGLLYGNGLRHVLQDFRQFTEFLALLWLVMQRNPSEREIAQLAGCYVAGATLIAVHGILQRYTGWGIPATQVVSDLVFHKGIRSGSFYGATPLGALMVLAIGTGFGLLLWVRSRALKFALGVSLALCLTAIVFTQTRASWAALALTIGFIVISVRLSPRLLILLVTAGIVFALLLGPLVARRMATLELSRTERSLLERTQYYTTAWHIFRAHPVFGLGWGCYYDMDQILANGRYVPADRPESGAQATVHSAYLQILVKAGLLGLFGLALILLHWVRRALYCFLEGDRRARAYLLYVGITGSVLGYLAHSAFENFFRWPVMAQSFWLLFGLSLVLSARVQGQKEA